jgi:hypothetical protein
MVPDSARPRFARAGPEPRWRTLGYHNEGARTVMTRAWTRIIAPLTGAVYETLVGHAEEGDADTL